MRWTLLFLLLLAACKLDCSSLPDPRPPEIVILPVRVEVAVPGNCQYQDELISILNQRLAERGCYYEGY
jgi:hypothetical protein